MADRIPLVIEGSQIREITSGDRLDLTGNALQVGGDITPTTDSAYDIGTSSLKFRDIYLSSGTIHLGGVKLRADGNKLSVQDSTGATAGLTAATLGTLSTDNLLEGSTNLFTTAARTRSHIQLTDAGGDGSLTFDSASGLFTYTGPSASEVRAHINVIDAGGDGSFAYDSALGKLTYTGPSASEVRAHFSAGTGVALSSGQISIGQPVATTDSVTFAGLTVSGDLTVSGTTTSFNSVSYTINDPLIHLADSNELSDVVDIGFIGHYYRDGSRRHAGLFRNADDQSFNLFNNMIDSAFDSALPPNVINTGATGYTLANLNAGTITATFSGNVTGNVTGDVSGNAGTATTLQTARDIQLSGDVTGTASFNGGSNINISTTIASNSVALGTDTVGNYVGTITGSSTITSSGATTGEGIDHTLSVTAGSISSTQLASASTLTIKNVAGTTLKTVIGAGI